MDLEDSVKELDAILTEHFESLPPEEAAAHRKAFHEYTEACQLDED